jgi:hypothetical protein
MSALFIGFLLVVLSAISFGVVLFGRRPIPQPATIGIADLGDDPSGAIAAETVPSLLHGGRTTAVRVRGADGAIILRTPPSAVHLSGRDVRSSPAVRLRSAMVLLFGALGTAVLVGTIASIVVVGALLLVS